VPRTPVSSKSVGYILIRTLSPQKRTWSGELCCGCKPISCGNWLLWLRLACV